MERMREITRHGALILFAAGIALLLVSVVGAGMATISTDHSLAADENISVMGYAGAGLLVPLALVALLPRG